MSSYMRDPEWRDPRYQLEVQKQMGIKRQPRPPTTYTVTPYPVPASAVGDPRELEEWYYIRKPFEETLTKAVAESKATFEEDLATQEAQARADFEKRLAEQKAAQPERTQLDWMTQETQARASFEQKLADARAKSIAEYQQKEAATRQKYAEAEAKSRAEFLGLVKGKTAEYKREYAMAQGRQVTPRELTQWRQAEQKRFATFLTGEKREFESLLKSEKEVFGERMKEWETQEQASFESELAAEKKRLEAEVEASYKEAVALQTTDLGEWKLAETKRFEEEITSWKAQETKEFEAELSSWAAGERSRLEGEVKEWRTQWQPKSFSEQIMDVAGKQVTGLPPQLQLPHDVMQSIAQVGAGVIATGESFVYGIGGLIGLKTPRQPPTVTGGLISSAIYSVQKGQLAASPELERLGTLPITYAAGTILGDVALALGVGYVAQKTVIQPLAQAYKGSRVEQFILSHGKVRTAARYLTKPEKLVTDPLGQLYRGSRMERFLLKKSDWYFRHFAPKLAPEVAFLPSADMPVGLGWLEAKEYGFESLMAGAEIGRKLGRTQLLSISKKAELVARTPQAAQLPIQWGLGSKILTGTYKPEGVTFARFEEAMKKLTAAPKGTMLYSMTVPVQLLEPQRITPLLKLGAEWITSSITSGLQPMRIGAGAILGVKGLQPISPSRLKEQLIMKPRAGVVSPQIPLLAPVTEAKTRQRPVLQVSTSLLQGLKQVQVTQVSPILQAIAPSVPILQKPRVRRPRGKVEKPADLILGRKGRRKIGIGKGEYLYPIRGVKSASEWILGNRKKQVRKSRKRRR